MEFILKQIRNPIQIQPDIASLEWREKNNQVKKRSKKLLEQI